MYAIAFDLTVAEAEQHHPKGVSQAYFMHFALSSGLTSLRWSKRLSRTFRLLFI